eukprot:463619_1
MILATISLIILSALLCESYDIYYTKFKEKASSTVDCPNNDICNLHITGKSACYRTTINCPIDMDCFINCHSQYSCYERIINCPLSGKCIIDCKGAESCGYVTVKTLDKIHKKPKPNKQVSLNMWKIECNGYRACYESNINGQNQNDTKLDISCIQSDNYRMYKSIIQCPPNGECNINIYGTNATASKLLHIVTSGAYVLSSTKVYCPMDGIYHSHNCIIDITKEESHSLYKTEIYAVEAMKDLKLTFVCKRRWYQTNDCHLKIADGGIGINSPQIFCKPDFNANCKLKFINNQFTCHTDSYCNTYKVTWSRLWYFVFSAIPLIIGAYWFYNKFMRNHSKAIYVSTTNSRLSRGRGKPRGRGRGRSSARGTSRGRGYSSYGSRGKSQHNVE